MATWWKKLWTREQVPVDMTREIMDRLSEERPETPNNWRLAHDLDVILDSRLTDPASRRKIAGYASSYLRDRLESAEWLAHTAAERAMLQRITKILKVISQEGC